MKKKAMFVLEKPNGNIRHDDIEKAFKKLNHSQQDLYCSLYGNTPFTLPGGTTLGEGVDLLGIWQQNSFSIDSGIEPKLFGNFAVRDIAAGEEITISYKNSFYCFTRAERNQLLGFTCRCQVCDALSKDKTLGEVSDMRRRLMRGLVYLLDGSDEYSEYHDGHLRLKPVICDPVMRKAADNCDFPLSAKLIQDLLLVVLKEVEGTLDEEEAANTWTHVWRRACSFGTKENRTIATLAVKHKTWNERLEIAFLLDGRADAADHMHTMAYRRARGNNV